MGDQIYFTIPGVATAKWIEQSQMVFVQWEGWANAAEFGALLDAEVRALKEHGGCRLLADCGCSGSSARTSSSARIAIGFRVPSRRA